jgi:hypothetical protein
MPEKKVAQKRSAGKRPRKWMPAAQNGQDPVAEAMNFYATKQTIFEEELPYLAKKKFFLIPQKVVGAKLHYVPCWWIVLDYCVTLLTKRNTREGRLDFIVDEIRGCSVMEQFLPVKLCRTDADRRAVLPQKLTEAQAEKKAIVDARWKVVMGQYKRPPELKTVSIRQFYRPYYEVALQCGGRVSAQWIPADDYDNYFTYQ